MHGTVVYGRLEGMRAVAELEELLLHTVHRVWGVVQAPGLDRYPGMAETLYLNPACAVPERILLNAQFVQKAQQQIGHGGVGCASHMCRTFQSRGGAARY
jgi:hypothetical protein